ncbi:MAG: AAA family ATPase [Candidatus Eremiobacteraeota bacterium]|nr:AAA family ATPase [Candidatus Eremiobacteraeota bacterium]
MIAAPVYCRRLIGRREQLDMLLARYRAASEGTGSVVLLCGEPGMGKSRVAAELCRAVQDAGGEYAIGESFEYLQVPFAPLRAIPKIQTALENARASADGDKAAIFEAVARCLQELSSTSPFLLVVEDLHWADAGTLELLHYLSTRIASVHVVVLATYRYNERSANQTLRAALARLERQNCVWQISLEPLKDGEIRSLMHEALNGRRALSPAILEAIRTSAEGNPLSAEELLKNAVDSTSLRENKAPALPASLSESVLERLRPLDEREQAVLQYAAAIGRKFDAQLLAAIAGADVQEIITVLRKAVDLQLVLEETRGERIGYIFRHALTRDTIYNQLIAAQARPLHERIAQALDASGESESYVAELAYHYWQARNFAKAAKYNERAGDLAAALCAFHEAASSYERTVEALSVLNLPSASVQLKWADALREAGEGERARRLYEKLLAEYEAAGDVEGAVAICLALRIVFYEAGDTERVRAVAQQAVDIAARAHNSVLYFRALVGLANGIVNTSSVHEVFGLLEQAREAVSEFPPGADVHYYFVLAGAHALFDRPCETREAFDRGLALALSREDWYRAAVTLVGFASDATRIGMMDAARDALQRYLAIVREHEIGPHSYLNTHVRCGSTYMELGDLELARQIVEESLILPVVETGLATLIQTTALFLGLRLDDQTMVERAVSPDFLDAATGGTIGHFTPLAVCALADLFRSRGEIQRAGEVLHRCIQRRWDGSGDDMCALSLRIGEYGLQDDIEPAREFLSTFISNAPTRFLRGEFELFEAYAARRSGDREALARHPESARALFDELGRLYELARTLELLERKAEAATIYRKTGDIAAAKRLEKHLTPVNRRGRAKTELTSREREIATLVAAGKSNLAIAEQLFIGERTVETHVSSILAKLGAENRAELTAIILRTATR